MTKLSVIIPCLNEEKTISHLLDGLLKQHYPMNEVEVIIADGLSTDATRARIETFQQQHPELRVRIIDNPRRRIPVGLNLAIDHAQGEIILRLDAHSVPHEEYLARSVQALEQNKGLNVGGVWEIRPGGQGWLAEAIATAAAHPLGVGDARYRYADHPGEVDTVPFGAFRRELIDQIGPFDENLETNEDYEFNARIRRAGGRVWLDPAIRSLYYARPTLTALARQYWRYGYWKWRMLRRYPSTLRWRQLLPPLFVLSLILLPILSSWWPWLIRLWSLEVVSYALLLLGAGALKGLQMSKLFMVLGLPLAVATMHLSWGSAFLWSMGSSGFRGA